MKKSDRMEYLCIQGGIILKWILKIWDWKSLASSDSGSGQVLGSVETIKNLEVK
jgi:hypothetical protein